jgi:RimJ/RimL family protein N-acetyltransferase
MNSTNRLLKLRKVREEDCELLWEWANDPIVRNYSFSSEPISWEEHLRWFNSKLNSSRCHHFIALNKQDEYIGQIRFDVNDELQSIVSISLANNHRNQGYGKLILEIGIEELSNYILVKNIQAFIKPENITSIKLFKSIGFAETNDSTPSVLHYIYTPNTILRSNSMK